MIDQYRRQAYIETSLRTIHKNK